MKWRFSILGEKEEQASLKLNAFSFGGKLQCNSASTGSPEEMCYISVFRKMAV
jgi:hypothetical protein